MNNEACRKDFEQMVYNEFLSLMDFSGILNNVGDWYYYDPVTQHMFNGFCLAYNLR